MTDTLTPSLFLNRTVAVFSELFTPSNEVYRAYVSSLNTKVTDRANTVDDARELAALAATLNIPPTDCAEINHLYLDGLGRSARSSGPVTERQLDELREVGKMLEIPAATIEIMLKKPKGLSR